MSMFVRESVEYCQACETMTPHSRRRFSLPVFLALASLAAGVALVVGWLLSWWDSAWIVPGSLLVFVGVFLSLRDREKFWRVHCERCRGKRIAQLRRTKPRLDGNTEINIT